MLEQNIHIMLQRRKLGLGGHGLYGVRLNQQHA